MVRICEDYVPERSSSSEINLIDVLCVGWGAWARNDGIDLRPTPAGDLWKIQAVIDARDYVLKLSDDEFLIVDKRIALLPRRLRNVVFVEYTSNAANEEKPRLLGLRRPLYRERLRAAQWCLFTDLKGFIDKLIAKSVKTLHTCSSGPQDKTARP